MSKLAHIECPDTEIDFSAESPSTLGVVHYSNKVENQVKDIVLPSCVISKEQAAKDRNI